MMQQWKLSSLDLFTLNMVIKGAWIYRQMPDIQELRNALSQLIKTYPHLTGHYQEKKKALVWEDNYTEEPVLETLTHSDLSVNDLLGHDEKAWSLVAPYSIKAFKQGKVMPLKITLIKLKDGALLLVQAAHATMDGYSFYRLMEQWAALTKGESIEPMVIDQRQIPQKDSLTKEETLELVKQKGWAKMKLSQFIGMLWNLFKLKSVKGTYVHEVAQEEIAALKQASGTGTHAILCAIAAKQLFGRLNQPTFNAIIVADLRGHLFGVSPNLMGNLSQPFITRQPCSTDMDTASLAQTLQKQMDEVLKSDTLDQNLRLSLCASHYGLPYYLFNATEMFNPRPTNLYVNNQLKLRACELDFGSGKPLYAFPNDLTDMIKFWQPVADGPVQIIYWGNAAKVMNSL